MVQQQDLHDDGGEHRDERQPPRPPLLRLRRLPKRRLPLPLLAPCRSREARHRGEPAADHRRDAGAERGDVVGVHDPPGHAQEAGLAQQEAAEHDQAGESRVAARRACERDRDHADEREHEHPCVLVAEAAAEQAQRPGEVPNATGLLVIVAATLGATSGAGVGRRTAEALAVRLRQLLVFGLHFQVGDRPGTAFLAADPSEAVVAERQPELGVVGRAADERALRSGREIDGDHPCQRQHAAHDACEQQVAHAATW